MAFARVALQFDDPNAGRPAGEPPRTRLDVLRRSEHPPGYPAAVWLASLPVRAVSGAPVAEQFILSTQLASLVAGVLLAVVHFRLGRELFGPLVGFLAAALFQVLPVVARITSDGLSEGLFLLAVGTALLCGVRAARAGRPASFFLCGLAAAAAYLVRPEGLLVAVVVGGLAVAQWLARAASSRASIGRAAALACGVLVLAGPYMALVGGVTNKPTGKKLLRWLGDPATDGPAAGATPLFASWFVPGTDGAKPAWVAASLAKELGKSFHYLPAALAALGLLTVGRRAWRTDPGARVPIAYGAAHLALLVGMAATSGYLSERHTLPVVFVGCLFAAAAVVPLGTWLAGRCRVRPRTATAALAATVFLTCLPAALRPRHDDRLGHLLAGKWLAEHAAAADTIVDPFDWGAVLRRPHALPAPARPARPAGDVRRDGGREGAGPAVEAAEVRVGAGGGPPRGGGVSVAGAPGPAGGTRVVVYKMTAAGH